MTDREEKILALVKEAGGALTGKVRLQKLTYLLDQLGLGSGFRFEYHHYGPFSRDLVNAVEDAKAFGLIQEDFGYRSFDSAPFSIFRAKSDEVDDKAFGELGKDRVHSLLAKLVPQDATILELAATAHWLWKYEHRTDWRDELKKRKGVKVQGGRLEKAIELLELIDLALPERTARPQ